MHHDGEQTLTAYQATPAKHTQQGLTVGCSTSIAVSLLTAAGSSGHTVQGLFQLDLL